MSNDGPPSDWGNADDDLLDKCRKADITNKKVKETKKEAQKQLEMKEEENLKNEKDFYKFKGKTTKEISTLKAEN